MRKIIFAIVIVSVCSSCSQRIYDALNWQSNKVTADGKIPEWSNPLRFYDHNSKINYNITNDRQNLYLCIKVSDETMFAKILRGGIEFRIDTAGKKSFSIAFIFPISNQEKMMQSKRSDTPTEKSSGEKSYSTLMMQKKMSQEKEVQLIGFKPPLGGILTLFNTTSGISAAINFDSLGTMYYEAIIPFRTFYKNELMATDSNKVFSYEIKVNGLPVSHEGGGGRAPGGMASGGGGGMGGGMRGGGNSGGGNRGGGNRGGGGGQVSANSEMNVTNTITTKMKFSFK